MRLLANGYRNLRVKFLISFWKELAVGEWHFQSVTVHVKD